MLIAAVLLAGLYIAVAYNSLVKKENAVTRTWSEMQNTYQRRLDLTQNLVNVVKGVSNFEQSTFTEIAAARSGAENAAKKEFSATTYNEQMQQQNRLSEASNRLIISVEKYPQLKGTSAYLGLQTQLEGTERRIKVARNDFNAAIKDYNDAARGFPKSFVAKLFGFKVMEGFTAETGSDKNKEIKF